MCAVYLTVFLSLHLSSESIQTLHPDSLLGTTPMSLLISTEKNAAYLFMMNDIDDNGANADADHNEKSFCCWSKSPNTLRGKESEGTSSL